MTCTSKEFLSWKRQALSGVDFSRKGSIDAPITEIVEFINTQDDYFTTSSCSGRCIVVEEDESKSVHKKGCRWLYTTHEICKACDVEEAVKKSTGDATFKFEPFVMHVQCRTTGNAQLLHSAAVAAGFRNSGITIGRKGKIITYISHITKLANSRMDENLNRIQRLQTNITTSFELMKIKTLEQISTCQKKGKRKPVECKKHRGSNTSDLDSAFKKEIQNTELIESGDEELVLDCIFEDG